MRGKSLLFRYVADRKSWILFYLFALLLADLLIWIDSGMAVQADSLLYLNLLLLLSMLAFLGWRFRIEARYARALADLAGEVEEDWVEALPPVRFYQEEATHQLLAAAGRLNRQKLSASYAARAVEQEYMAAWVHEVKAPLTAMKLTIDAHRSDPAIRKMESEWLRVHLLIDQQLYISRLPSLESDFVLEETGIQQLVALEVRELASWCVEKNMAVEFEGEEAFVRTDRKWCRFIIRQLLSNAVKYSPQGGMIVWKTAVSPDGHVRITIKDEGPGIADHDLPRIFDKGFTGGNGRLQNAATGLGLYLAQTVASKIGIQLSARSVLHEGTEMDMIFNTRNTFEVIRS
jgi:two-component system, OmpR family, bacitracin resistance sensor histidine kinase BceS